MKNPSAILILFAGLWSGAAWADARCPDAVLETQAQSGRELVACIRDKDLSWVVEIGTGVTVRLFENGTELGALEGLGEEVLGKVRNKARNLVLRTFVPPQFTRSYLIRRNPDPDATNPIEILTRIDTPLGALGKP